MRSQIAAHLPALRTLVLVVDSGSFTEAGKKARLTPSAVSKQLGRLEDVLGVRLFERTTRNVRPTLAGLELCLRVRPLFESFEDAARAVSDQQERIEGRLRISAAPAYGRAVLVPALHALSLAHPGLQFELRLTGRRLDFVEDEIDLAIREGALVDSSLVARPLGLAHVGLYASAGYVKRRGAPRSLAELVRHDVVSIPPAAAGLGLHPELRRLALVPRFQVDDLFAVAELAEAGAGIAPLPDYVARARVERGSLARLLPRTDVARFPIHAVYPSRRHLPRRVQAVVEALTPKGG
jgi:DNA-binding transcriptional LysR family regulator